MTSTERTETTRQEEKHLPSYLSFQPFLLDGCESSRQSGSYSKLGKQTKVCFGCTRSTLVMHGEKRMTVIPSNYSTGSGPTAQSRSKPDAWGDPCPWIAS